MTTIELMMAMNGIDESNVDDDQQRDLQRCMQLG